MFLISSFGLIQLILVLLALESVVSEAICFLTENNSRNPDSVHWFGMKDV